MMRFPVHSRRLLLVGALVLMLFGAPAAQAFKPIPAGHLAHGIVRIDMAEAEESSEDALSARVRDVLGNHGWDVVEAEVAGMIIGASGSFHGLGFASGLAPSDRGRSVCLAVVFDAAVTKLMNYADVPESAPLRQAVKEFIFDHEEAHCRSLAVQFTEDKEFSLWRWIEESQADAYAILKAREKGEMGQAVIRAWRAWRLAEIVMDIGELNYWTLPLGDVAQTGDSAAVRRAARRLQRGITAADLRAIEAGWSDLRHAVIARKLTADERNAVWEKGRLAIPKVLHAYLPSRDELRQAVGRTERGRKFLPKQ